MIPISSWRRAWRKRFEAAVKMPDIGINPAVSHEEAYNLICQNVGLNVNLSDDSLGQIGGLIALYRWRSIGFPHLVLGPQRAAYYAATRVHQELELQPPWPAFYISLRDSCLQLDDQYAVGVVASCEPGGSWVVAVEFTDGRVSFAALPPDEFHKTNDIWDDMENDRRITSGAHQRLMSAIIQLIAGVCVEFQAHPEVCTDAHKRSRSKATRIKHGRLGEKAFVFTDDVIVDARAAVTEFILYGGKSPTVKSFTRPHARRQHYGPGNSQVKVIRIEGFWRGPKDGPVAVRSHRFREDAHP